MAREKYYITTAIDYVNAAPHIGHAYEKILADAIARWQRLQGKEVKFLTGTDENAQKNEQAAKEAGIPTQEFVDKNSQIFVELCKALNISYDEFIKTTESRHKEKSQEIFKKVYEKGEIYKDTYEGHYCEGCEAFVTERDLVDGKCPEHNKEPKFMSEPAYFFKLSNYKDQIIKLIEEGLVQPKTKANEILSRLKEEGLRDLCVSRTNLEWGIDSPIDSQFKIYVWFDALINYITGSGSKEEFWPADCHVIGKGINWFHSVIWPAMLLSAGYDLPKKVWVHGYLTIEGNKISKSLGNTINPLELVKKYPSDSIRYVLLREIPYSRDGDFSEKTLIEKHNSELADKLGNLVARVSALAEKYGLEEKESNLGKDLIKEYKEHLGNLEIDKAINILLRFTDLTNEYIQEKKPWETKDTKVLYELANAIKDIAILFSPFIPETSEKIAKTFNFEISLEALEKTLKISKIKKSEILFKKIE